MTMQDPDAMSERSEMCYPPSGQKINKQIREAEVDIGGKETTTAKLMRPQDGKEIEG